MPEQAASFSETGTAGERRELDGSGVPTKSTTVRSGVVRRNRRARSIRFAGALAYVPLTKGYEAIIDAADAPLVANRNWYALTVKAGVYAAREHDGKMQRLHSLILPAPAGMMVDHINRNPLDNRRANLRLCTAAENAANKSVRSDNKLGRKGVYPRGDRFGACLSVAGRTKHLGVFLTVEEAGSAYDEAAKAAFGEFWCAG